MLMSVLHRLKSDLSLDPLLPTSYCQYVLAVSSCCASSMNLWQDPPHYWEQVVHPAYVEAHFELFEDGDVENGKPTGQKVGNLVLIDTLEMGTSDVVNRCCKILLEHAKSLEVGR